MARCTLVSTFRIILGVAQQCVETSDCVNYCPAPVMYLLNTDPSHDRSPYIPLALRKWYTEWTLSVYTSPPSPVSPVRKIRGWNAWQICLSSVNDPLIRFSLFFRSRICDARFFLFLFLSREYNKSFNERKREREKKRAKFLSFAFIERYCLYCYEL